MPVIIFAATTMKYFLFIACLVLSVQLMGQSGSDSVRSVTRPVVKRQLPVTRSVDSAALRARAISDSLRHIADTSGARLGVLLNNTGLPLRYRDIIALNPCFNFFAVPENIYAEERPSRSKDALFYIFAGLLFFFALVKLLFNRYVSNLLGLIFRGSLRQKQIREQLLQTPLPSLFLNIFFVVVAGMYVFYLIQYYKMAPYTAVWLQIVYCVLVVGLVYLAKFVILKLTGWIFNMRDAADTYIFIVFLVNKLLAIFLLPLLIVMVFSLASWAGVLLTLSYIMVVLFFAYRYVVSFAPVRREVKVSQFHFFMYLCAFEIVPLLLIYKVLVHYF